MRYNTETEFYTKLNLPDHRNPDVRQILVVCDLHLSEGYSPENFHWNRRENFTADKAFARFLRSKHKAASKKGYRIRLIINGDFIDFLRITATPQSKEEVKDWETTLRRIIETRLPRQRQRVLEAFNKFAARWSLYLRHHREPFWKWPPEVWHEVKYGLKTQDFKSIYRLMVARDGHEVLFQALAEWLGNGHQLTIISGNHDQEFNQILVQKGFLWMLEDIYKKMSAKEQLARANHPFVHSGLLHDEFVSNGKNNHEYALWQSPVSENWSDPAFEPFGELPDFSQSLTFVEHGLEINGQIRIEHGHRFEWMANAERWQLDPANDPHQEIFLAPGSLFNRYLLNRVELEVPYLDNVKPATRVIGYLALHHPWRFAKMFFKLLRATVYLARKRGPRRLIWAGLLRFAMLVLPSFYSLWALLMILRYGNDAWLRIWHGPSLFGLPFPFYLAVPFFLLYVFSLNTRLKKMKLHFSLQDAKKKMSWHDSQARTTGKRYAICGHTHEADIQPWGQNIIHINSGTWTPVFQYDGGHVRNDLTMTFVELNEKAGRWEAKLRRWDPNCERETEMILMEKKSIASCKDKRRNAGQLWQKTSDKQTA